MSLRHPSNLFYARDVPSICKYVKKQTNKQTKNSPLTSGFRTTDYWTWAAISWIKVLCFLFLTVHPWPPPYTDFSLFTLLRLTSFFAAVIIATAARDHCQTTNVNTGLIRHSYFQPVWLSFWWGLARWLRKAVMSQLWKQPATQQNNIWPYHTLDIFYKPQYPVSKSCILYILTIPDQPPYKVQEQDKTPIFHLGIKMVCYSMDSRLRNQRILITITLCPSAWV